MKSPLRASDLPDSLKAYRAAFERTIPVGFEAYDEPLQGPQDKQLWDEFHG